MTLIVVLFFTLLLITFIILFVAGKPGKQQKLVQQRFAQMNLGNQPTGGQDPSEELLKQTSGGRLAWLESFLSRFGFHSRLEELLAQANSTATPAKVVITSSCLAVGALAAASLFLPLLIVQLAAVIAGAAAPVLLLRFQRTRRVKAFNSALPDSIDLMARALRAGHSVASAIEVVSEEGQEPVSSEFGLVYQQQNFGLPFRDALMRMAQRNQSQDLQFVVTAMLVQKETGGNLAEILDRTTYVIRERLRILGEVRIKSAQGRLTGWILTVMPIVMGILLHFMNPGFERPLFEEHLGHVMLYSGGAMLVIGSLLIRKIVTIEV